MRLAVIGTGHVGLVTAAALASAGHEVVGTDADQEKITRLREGSVPFHEPGLEELVAGEVGARRLAFTFDAAEAIRGAEVVFICVGTPPRASGEASLLAVERAARQVARHAVSRVVVAEKSTVPTGTAERLRETLRRERPDLDLEVVCNPEFLREGTAVRDAVHPDRVLVGAESEWAFEAMRQLYAPVVAGGCRLIETDIRTAEMAKYATNTFLALKISFVNALARLCERSGADVVAVAEVMGADPRIGDAFLGAGIGYGGSCFPKDLVAFERLAVGLGYEFPLLREIARINDEALEAMVDKVRQALWVLEDKRVGLLGLSFKAGTDDVRFSPALALARRLLEEGARVVGFDPVASANAKADVPELEIAADPYDAAAEADCLVLCTAWEEFRRLDLARLKTVMVHPVMVDGRNAFDPDEMRAAGWAYYPTGRPPVG